MIVNLKKTKNPLLINFIYSISAQMLTLLVNVLMILVVPKFMGIIDFSYWQLFLLYTSYIGFFHLGLNDGIYLKEGGKKLNEINIKRISSQFKVAFVIQMLICFLLIGITDYFKVSIDKGQVLLFTFLLIPVTNGSFFLMYILQATNEIKKYVFSILIEKFLFITCLFILIFNNINNYEVYIMAFTGSKLASFGYLLYVFRDFIFSGLENIKCTMNNVIENITIGIPLLFANISGLLIMGYPRLAIESSWGIKTFGVISFALIIVSFFLMFINQIGLILFPHLRRINLDASKKIYLNLKKQLGIFLPIIFVIYIPLIIILKVWLPQYGKSFEYIYLVLPIVLYESKVNILYNTYLKVYREEKKILIVNFFVLVFSIFSINVVVKFFENVTFILIVLIISVALRSILLEICVERKLKLNQFKNIYIQNISVIAFIMASMLYEGDIERFLIGFIFYLIYFLSVKFIDKTEGN